MSQSEEYCNNIIHDPQKKLVYKYMDTQAILCFGIYKYIFISYIHILGDIDDHKLRVKELIQNLLVMFLTFCQRFWLLVSLLYKKMIRNI